MNTTAEGKTVQALVTALGPRPLTHTCQPQELQSLVLNQAGFGVCLVDAGLELVYANQRAEALFCERFFPSRGRLMNGDNPAESRRVRSALLDALAGQAQIMELDFDGARIAVAFSPIQLAEGRNAALVTLERSETAPEHMLQAYARSIRLTRRETAVTACLARGLDPTETATELGVAVETVRTHIRAILGKSRAGNMRELLVRVSRLPPMMASARPARPSIATSQRNSQGLAGAAPTPSVRPLARHDSAGLAGLAFRGGLDFLTSGQAR